MASEQGGDPSPREGHPEDSLGQETPSGGNATTEVATAILFQGDRFLMQLRDDIPGIVYPGHWTFFGGHLEPGESPEVGVWRELEEEISYRPPWLRLFRRQRQGQIIRNVFYGPLEVALTDLILGEGWDMALWTIPEIQAGVRSSAIANQVRPMGTPHQALLLTFIEEQGLGSQPSPPEGSG